MRRSNYIVTHVVNQTYQLTACNNTIIKKRGTHILHRNVISCLVKSMIHQDKLLHFYRSAILHILLCFPSFWFTCLISYQQGFLLNHKLSSHFSLMCSLILFQNAIKVLIFLTQIQLQYTKYLVIQPLSYKSKSKIWSATSFKKYLKYHK